MYSVSDAYKNAIKNPVITYTITGTIGSLSFSAANLVAGSFNLSNQNCEANRMAPGGVFIGQLEAEFIGINLSYDAWMNKKITPSIVVDLGNNQTETIPLGIFKIKEAKHTAQGVRVKAYDNMIKLDRKFKKSHFHTPGSMKDFIDIVCADCHLNLVNSEADINSMAQGSEEFSLYGASEDPKEFLNDIETYRDLVYWIAQSLGAFATINRNGDLWFRQFDKANVVDEVSDSYRLSGAEFESFQTAFTGVYFEDLDTGDVHYYGYDITALQAEVTTLTVERQNVQTDLADLETAYQQGQIDEATYKAQKKVYEREIKQLTKRINKLNALIAEMQDGDQDGTDIDCGSNPFMMNTNLTTRAAQRTAVLTAIQKAQFTPFTCSTILGIHYDLGDVIHFTGGHTSGDGEYCIINSFDWTYNGEYGMQGFGSEDESKNIKTKEAKKAKQATGDAAVSKKIAESKPDVTVSTNPPSGGKTGDIHVQTGTAVHKAPKYEVVWENEERTPYKWGDTIYPPRDDVFSPTAIVWDEATNSYNMEFYGSVSYYKIDDHSYCQGGKPILRIKNLPHDAGVHWYRMRAESVSYEIIGNNTEHAWYSSPMGLQARRYQETDTTGFPPPGDVYTNSICFDLDGGGGPYQTDVEISDGGTDPNHDYSIKLFVQDFRARDEDNWDAVNFCRLTITGFKFEYYTDYEQKVTDGGYTETDEPYVGDVSVKDQNGNWQTIQRIADIDEPTDAEEGGLQLTQNTKKISLKKNVVRVKFRQQPPLNKNPKNFAQFGLRCTGKPDANINITWQSGASWENKELTKDGANVYKIKCGGSLTANVDYACYKIAGLTSGKKYYINTGVNISDNAKFGKRDDKSCGIIFTDSSTVPSNADNISGHEDTWDATNLYYSFKRTTGKNSINFDFTATAATMYMYFLTGDFTGSNSVNITLYNFVMAQNERGYIRDLYMMDWEKKQWLKYVPFTAQTGGGEEPSGSTVEVDPILTAGTHIADIIVDGETFELFAPAGTVINSLDDIGDVEITSPTTGQTLKYNATTQKWENGADTGGADAVEITWAAYQALTPAQKADATKVYYITDYPSGGGGGGGGSAYSETEIYSGSTIVSTVTMTDSFTNYDALQFTTGFDYNSNTFLTTATFPCSDLADALTSGHYITMGYSTNNYCFGQVTSDSEFENVYGDGYLFSIKGIKY